MLSHDNARTWLLVLVKRSKLPRVVFAQRVLGRDPRTMQRWLAPGGRIPACMRLYLSALRSVQVRGEVVTVRMAWPRANPLWSYYRLKSNRARYAAGEGKLSTPREYSQKRDTRRKRLAYAMR